MKNDYATNFSLPHLPRPREMKEPGNEVAAHPRISNIGEYPPPPPPGIDRPRFRWETEDNSLLTTRELSTDHQRDRGRAGEGLGGWGGLAHPTLGQVGPYLWFRLPAYPFQKTKRSQKRDIFNIPNAFPATYGTQILQIFRPSILQDPLAYDCLGGSNFFTARWGTQEFFGPGRTFMPD